MLFHLIRKIIAKTKSLTQGLFGLVPRAFYGSFLMFCTVFTIFWASIFFYVTFYVVYLPEQRLEWPLHFTFYSCQNQPGICSNPTAEAQLHHTELGSLLAKGQKYDVFLDLKMPDSPVNHNLGMFGTKLTFTCMTYKCLQSSSAMSTRSTLLDYQSHIFRYTKLLLFSPLYLTGFFEESIKVTIKLQEDLIENPERPIESARVEVQSRFIQLYEGRLRLEAQFSGLKYVMFYYPVVAAILGTLSVLNFLVISLFISWYELVSKKHKMHIEARRKAIASLDEEKEGETTEEDLVKELDDIDTDKLSSSSQIDEDSIATVGSDCSSQESQT